MTRLAPRWPCWVLALAALPAAAGSEPLGDGLRRCAREADEHQRLICFDALVSTLPQIKSDQFGMTVEIAHKRDPSVGYQKIDALTATLSGLQEAAAGQWIFTLDNGQIWIQTEPKPGLHFSRGESIRIEEGAMGSLWLAADHHRKTRVKRVQ